MPVPSKARHYARTLKDWVGECWTHSCVRVLLIVFIYQGVCCVCVWRPPANVPIGNVNLQVSPRWGVRGRGEGYDWTTWGLDCVPGLRSADVLRSVTCARPALQRLPASPLLIGSLQVQPNRAKARLHPPPRRFAIGPAPQPQPNVMSAESSTTGNRLNP